MTGNSTRVARAVGGLDPRVPLRDSLTADRHGMVISGGARPGPATDTRIFWCALLVKWMTGFGRGSTSYLWIGNKHSDTLRRRFHSRLGMPSLHV